MFRGIAKWLLVNFLSDVAAQLSLSVELQDPCFDPRLSTVVSTMVTAFQKAEPAMLRRNMVTTILHDFSTAVILLWLVLSPNYSLLHVVLTIVSTRG